MHPLVRFARWFNASVPWLKARYRLTALAEPRLPHPAGPEVYTGIEGGLRLKLDLRVNHHRHIYLNAYEPLTLGLIQRLLRPGDTFVDGGANIGLLTLLGSRAVGPKGRVICFEPMPVTCAWLQENLKLNGAGNVTVVPQGCWHEPGSAPLYGFAEAIDPLSSMGKRQAEAAVQVTIALTTIDAHVAPPVRLLKLDVEGAEWSALRGAVGLLRSATPPHLLLEIATVTADLFGYHPMQMIDWVLEQAPGYQLRMIRSRRIEPITRDAFARQLAAEPQRSRNLWLEPA